MDWNKEHADIAYRTFDALHKYLQTEMDSDIEKKLKEADINYSTILRAKVYYDMKREK